MFENHSMVIDDEELKRYSKEWHRPAVAKDIEKYDAFDSEDNNSVISILSQEAHR